MAAGHPQRIGADTVIHRIGGGHSANLRLSPLDRKEVPPGISVLLDDTPQEAANQMRQAFPKSRKWQNTAHTVASATVADVRQVGFDVIFDPTPRFPNHARLIHPQGETEFSDANLAKLAIVFRETKGC